MTAPPALLTVRDGSYTYPAGPTALDGVDLTIRRGERQAILGGNGSGKSTLLLGLNATLALDRGEIAVEGVPLGSGRSDRNEHRRRVGLVLQDPDDQLFSASVFEDVSFGPLNLGLDETEARARVEQVLGELRLDDLAERPAHLLSFGQRKRVAIAGVAAMRPDVMLLDEPFAGLDPTARVDVLAAFDRLERLGTTIVLATHDVDLAYAWADRVTLLSSGTVVADGPPTTVLADAERCAAAGLRRPPIVDLLDAVVANGLLPTMDAARVRSVDELAAALRSVAP